MATYKQPCIHCGTMIERDDHLCPHCGSRSPFGYHCPACLRAIERTDAVCSGCGRPLVTACPRCGRPVFAGDDVCASCGASLLIICPNKLCHQPQFFENTKCTVCGKRIKK